MIGKERKPKNGATILEIALSIGLMAIILTVVLTSLVGWRNQSSLKAATQQMGTLLREAQNRSMNQASGTTWGVHFDNTTPTAPFYALFFTSYSAATTINQVRLPERVNFSASSVPSGTSLDIIFERSTGVPSTSTTIILELGGGGGSANISRSASGLIFFDDFNRGSL